jgi:hypothetical protein
VEQAFQPIPPQVPSVISDEQSFGSKVKNWRLNHFENGSERSEVEREPALYTSTSLGPIRYPAPPKSESSRSSVKSGDAITILKPIPSDFEILTELRCVLKDSDLSKSTRRSIRKELEKRLRCNLDPKKELINQEVARFL